MTSLTYCSKCLMPSSKPYIRFDENGVCNGCESARQKQDAVHGIDWQRRQRDFEDLVAWSRSQNAPYYDAMVPVSGGKDSITQVHRLLGRGLRILAVNVDYGIKTELGRTNLECIPAMGANLFIFRPEMDLHKRLIRIGLEDYGDPDLLSHTLLHAYPLHVARQFRIPLCLLGENSAFEYGGDQELASDNEMTRRWFNSYAANKGMTAQVISTKYQIPNDLLWQYDFPDEVERDADIQAVFSSGYFRWDSNEHLAIARDYGFKELDRPGEGTYRTFVGIDEKINRLHQYIKVLKFGYGRATDHASEDIRLGVLSRDEGKELVRRFDLQELGEDFIEDICHFLGYRREELLNILESFRNLDLWAKKDDGSWSLTGHLGDER